MLALLQNLVFWNGLIQQITRCFTSIRILVSMESFSWRIGMHLHQLALGIQLSCSELSSWRKISLLPDMTSEIQTPKNKRCCELQLSRDVKKNPKLLSKIFVGNRSSRVLEFLEKILDKFKSFVLVLEGVSLKWSSCPIPFFEKTCVSQSKCILHKCVLDKFLGGHI